MGPVDVLLALRVHGSPDSESAMHHDCCSLVLFFGPAGAPVLAVCGSSTACHCRSPGARGVEESLALMPPAVLCESGPERLGCCQAVQLCAHIGHAASNYQAAGACVRGPAQHPGGLWWAVICTH